MRELVAGVHPVHVRLQRDHEAVGVEVELFVEDLDGSLHAHDAEGNAVHHHVASDRVDATEELGPERGADDGDRAASPPVVFGETAAAADRPVHERRVLRREPGDEDALGASGDPHAGRLRRPRQEGESALVRSGDTRQVFVAKPGAHGEPLLLLRRLRLLGLDDDGAVPGHPLEPRSHLVEDAVEHGREHHQREDAQHEQRQGEDRPQLVRPQLHEAARDHLEHEVHAGAPGEPATHNAGPPSGRDGWPSTPGRGRRRTRRPRRGGGPMRSSWAA